MHLIRPNYTGPVLLALFVTLFFLDYTSENAEFYFGFGAAFVILYMNWPTASLVYIEGASIKNIVMMAIINASGFLYIFLLLGEDSQALSNLIYYAILFGISLYFVSVWFLTRHLQNGPTANVFSKFITALKIIYLPLTFVWLDSEWTQAQSEGRGK
jgi:hypothetical protein